MLKDSQLDLCGRVDFARTTPLLARDEAFSFACAGCGGCCRGREDIVLSGFDLWRIAARLRLPPQTVARAFCRASIGQVSHLPVVCFSLQVSQRWMGRPSWSASGVARMVPVAQSVSGQGPSAMAGFLAP